MIAGDSSRTDRPKRLAYDAMMPATRFSATEQLALLLWIFPGAALQLRNRARSALRTEIVEMRPQW